MNSTLSPKYMAFFEARLGEITESDRANLTRFAERRLAAAGAPPSCGEDITQRAFHAVLIGVETDEGGRKPRLVDLSNKPAFLNYMRGIISSLVYAMTHKRMFHRGHNEWDDNIAAPNSDSHSPANQAALRELADKLFPQLRLNAPGRLLPTIAAWESVFLESDRIPAPGHRKYVREVRELAQKVLPELGDLRPIKNKKPNTERH